MRFEWLMRMNPELGRNILLDINRGKVITAPMIMAGIYYLVYLMDKNDFARSALGVSATMFFLCTGLLASGSIAASMLEEKNSGTWDLQRMNATGPFSMALGKFVGGGAFGWYIALISFVAYWGCLLLGTWSREAISGYMFLGLSMPLIAILAQGVAFLAAIIMVQQGRQDSKVNIVGPILISAWLCSSVVPIALNITETETLEWFGIVIRANGFFMFTLFVYSSWVLVGAYRLMRQELQMKNGPGVWLGFELFTVIFVSGLAFEGVGMLEPMALSATAGFFVSFGFTYLTAASDSSNIIDYERIINSLRQRDFRRLSMGLPLWVLSLMVTFVAFVVTFALVASVPGEGGVSSMAFVTAGAFGLLLRDMMVLLSVRLSGKVRKPGVVAVIIFLVLYVLLPGILSAGGWTGAAAVFVPIPDETVVVSVIIISAQALAALMVLLAIWRGEQERMDIS